jgi:rubrerythrin
MKKEIKDALKTALNGENTAVKKYGEYAKKAAQDGYPNVAYLFRALVYAEKIHIKNHTNALKEDYESDLESYKVENTLENIQNSYDGEMHEHKNMYPDLRKKIRKNQTGKPGQVADLSMEWAAEVELTHAEILKKALKAVKNGQDGDFQKLYVCRVCGNMRIVKKDEVCPVCGHDAKFYHLIERNGEI